MLFIAKSVAGCSVFETDSRCNIACVAGFKIFTVISVHLQNTAHSFAVLLNCVVNSRAGIYCTGIYTEITNLTYKRVGGNLKCKSCKGLGVRRNSLLLFVGIGIDTLNSFYIGRSRHIINNGVKKRLNTLVAVRCTAADRNHFVCYCSLTDNCLHLLNRGFFTLKVFFHQFVVHFNNRLNQSGTILFGKLFHIIGDGLVANILTEIIIINFGIVVYEVNDTSECVFTADRKLNRNCIAVEALFNHIKHMIEIGTHYVHFINIDHAGYFIFVSLMPNGFRLRLNTALCAKHGYRTVKHTQRTLNFNRKVNVSGGVDNIDTMVFPETCGSSRSNGNTTLLLLSHPVHGSAAVVSFTHLTVYTGVEKDTLGGSSFTGVDMSHNTNISCHFKRYFSWHFNLHPRFTRYLTNYHL